MVFLPRVYMVIEGSSVCASDLGLGLCGTRASPSLIAACVFIASTLLSLRSNTFCALINFRASPIDLFMKGKALVSTQEVSFFGCFATEICNEAHSKTMCYLLLNTKNSRAHKLCVVLLTYLSLFSLSYYPLLLYLLIGKYCKIIISRVVRTVHQV